MRGAPSLTREPRPVRPAARSPSAWRTATVAAARYFSLVFGAGFLLGMVRVPLLVPRWGERWAELAEMPLMALVIVFAARHVVRRYGAVLLPSAFVAVGAIALAGLLAAEASVALGLSGLSLAQAIAARDPVSGSVYLLMLVVYAALPAWLAWRGTPAPALRPRDSS